MGSGASAGAALLHTAPRERQQLHILHQLHLLLCHSTRSTALEALLSVCYLPSLCHTLADSRARRG